MGRVLSFVLSLTVLGMAVFAQPYPVSVTFNNPSGLACQSGQATLYAAATTIMFTCQSGVFVQVTGGGGNSIAPFTTDGTNVTLPAGRLSVGGVLIVPVTISTSGPVTVSAWGFYFNNASGALTFNLPAITSTDVGTQYCFRNFTGKSGAITLKAPVSTYFDVAGVNGTVAGTLVSGGALGDSACVVSISTTQYMAYTGSGSWTNN
jgi:hypothetical protein